MYVCDRESKWTVPVWVPRPFPGDIDGIGHLSTWGPIMDTFTVGTQGGMSRPLWGDDFRHLFRRNLQRSCHGAEIATGVVPEQRAMLLDNRNKRDPENTTTHVMSLT